MGSTFRLIRYEWKKYIKTKIKDAALKQLQNENRNKRTKNIAYDELEMQGYLKQNQNKELARIIFSVRAGTFDVKSQRQWKYSDNLCVGCEKQEETFGHFMQCESLGETKQSHWENIFNNNTQEQYEIAKEVKTRRDKRDIVLKTDDSGHSGSIAPETL